MVFGALVCAFQVGFSYYKSQEKPLPPEVKFNTLSDSSIELEPFNPNDYTADDWKKIGFKDAQIQTILKYKEIIGGEFKSKEQLRKCYAFNDENFSRIEAFIELPQTFKTNSEPFSRTKSLNIKGKFNPNSYSQKDWMNLGFSEKQALNIIKYKNYLGGSFVSKEKFKECYMISDENYRQLAPYLILQEKTPAEFNNQPKQKAITYQKFNPNDLSAEGWQKLGFSLKQAESIIKYKEKKLKGQFRTLDDLKNCFMISEEKFNQLKNYVILPESSIESKSSEKKATDFSKIDLNQITFNQLKEFGFDDKAARTYMNFRKKLGGFVTTQQVLQTYNLDPILAEKLIQTGNLDVSKVRKYTLHEAPEEWLKEHPYFKYSAEKIIQLRNLYPNEADIWKNLKVKPEYEQRMKLYLK